jgi:hypothetical protein
MNALTTRGDTSWVSRSSTQQRVGHRTVGRSGVGIGWTWSDDGGCRPSSSWSPSPVSGGTAAAAFSPSSSSLFLSPLLMLRLLLMFVDFDWLRQSVQF